MINVRREEYINMGIEDMNYEVIKGKDSWIGGTEKGK
jgi:hypothetical protein